jgi:hypothetical protein
MISEIEGGSTVSHCVENSLWTCRKTDYEMNEYFSFHSTSGLQFSTLKRGQIVGPETLVFNLNQTPGNYLKEDNLNSVNHSESLKFNINK